LFQVCDGDEFVTASIGNQLRVRRTPWFVCGVPLRQEKRSEINNCRDKVLRPFAVESSCLTTSLFRQSLIWFDLGGIEFPGVVEVIFNPVSLECKSRTANFEFEW
jgi:hypothetical protein